MKSADGTSEPPGARPELDENLEHMRRLWGLYHALQDLSRRILDRLGVNGPQRMVVIAVGRLPGASAGELAELLQIHPSTLNYMLRQLERNDVIRRTVDPADSRRVTYSLRAAGRRIDAERANTIEDVLLELRAVMPQEKLDVTKEVVDALTRAIRQAIDRADSIPREDFLPGRVLPRVTRASD